jgi:hypothetical protein
MLKPLLVALSFVSLSACVVRVAPAPVRVERHPAYLQAITDLRHARAHLERAAALNGAAAFDESSAIRDLDAAITQAREAAFDDGKNSSVLPPVDLPADYSNRLRRGLELLERARGDLAREEDNAVARVPQQLALGFVDQAIGFVRAGMTANAHAVPPPPPRQQPVVVAPPPPPQQVVVIFPPAHHPAYLHALADLRHARGLLERPAVLTRNAAFDEVVALREVEVTMNELRQAAIDDGKNVNEHPAVDVRLDWRGRLHQSLTLLRSARRDVAQAEDNPQAVAVQRRALQHLDAAIGYVEAGLRANRW